jgi:hypothetical protein
MGTMDGIYTRPRLVLRLSRRYPRVLPAAIPHSAIGRGLAKGCRILPSDTDTDGYSSFTSAASAPTCANCG